MFRVPIHGNLLLLLALSVIYLMALLSMGLLVSSWAKTQMEAIQITQMFLLPSIMLSGYIFPLSSLPGPLRVLSQILPATHDSLSGRSTRPDESERPPSSIPWRNATGSTLAESTGAPGHEQ